VSRRAASLGATLELRPLESVRTAVLPWEDLKHLYAPPAATQQHDRVAENAQPPDMNVEPRPGTPPPIRPQDSIDAVLAAANAPAPPIQPALRRYGSARTPTPRVVHFSGVPCDSSGVHAVTNPKSLVEDTNEVSFADIRFASLGTVGGDELVARSSSRTSFAARSSNTSTHGNVTKLLDSRLASSAIREHHAQSEHSSEVESEHPVSAASRRAAEPTGLSDRIDTT